MTAALNCLRAGKSVLVLEGESFGGQIAFSPRVENFPTYQKISGAELMDKLYEQISEWGARIELECVESVKKKDSSFVVTTDYGVYEGISVIFATGVKPRRIGVAREEELIGNGVSYCALCDGAFYSGEEVAVIGDANTAIQYAVLLSEYCKKVHVCALFDKLFADKALIDVLNTRDNITVQYHLSLKEFLGDEEVCGLKFENTLTHEQVKIDCKCAFVCIGQIPNNEKFKSLVEINDGGYIVAGEDCITSCNGAFAAGDCRTKKIRQLVTAANDGAIAAFNACKYVDQIKSL